MRCVCELTNMDRSCTFTMGHMPTDGVDSSSACWKPFPIKFFSKIILDISAPVILLLLSLICYSTVLTKNIVYELKI